MAKVKDNLILGNISGKIGDIVVKRRKNGQVYVSKRPIWTEKSRKSNVVKENNKLFAEAVKFAKEVLNDTELRKKYENEAKSKNMILWNFVISKYLKERKEKI